MKKLLALILTLVLCLCCITSLGEGELAGGWTLCDVKADIPEEALLAFDTAMQGLVGVGYEPVALLSTQLVAGMNYCFLCKATPVVPNAVSSWAYVYVYADLNGGAEITCIGNIEQTLNEEPVGRADATEYEFTASPDEELYICDIKFNGEVAIHGEGQAITFVNCEFCGNVVSYANSQTQVRIMGDCEFCDGAHCVLKSGTKEADMDYSIPKFVICLPVQVECEDLGGVISTCTDEVVFDGKTYTLDDAQYYIGGDDSVGAYEEGMEVSVLIVMHWWENGEEIVFTAAG